MNIGNTGKCELLCFSVVFINDAKQKTLVIDDKTLIVADKTLLAGDRIKVSQVDKENSVLSSTKTYLIGGTEESPTIEVDTNIIYKERGLKTSTAIAIILISLAVLSVCTTITVRILHKKKLENNKLYVTKKDLGKSQGLLILINIFDFAAC